MEFLEDDLANFAAVCRESRASPSVRGRSVLGPPGWEQAISKCANIRTVETETVEQSMRSRRRMGRKPLDSPSRSRPTAAVRGVRAPFLNRLSILFGVNVSTNENVSNITIYVAVSLTMDGARFQTPRLQV